MSKATDFLLSSLREYLDKRPASERKKLYRLHEKMCDGRRLSSISASRHLNLYMTPRLDTGLVYLRFAQISNLIEACPAEEGLFRYVIEKAATKPARKPAKKP